MNTEYTFVLIGKGIRGPAPWSDLKTVWRNMMTNVRIAPEETDLGRARYEAMPLEQRTLDFRTFLERRAEVEKMPTTGRKLRLKFENWLSPFSEVFDILLLVAATYVSFTSGVHYKSGYLALLTFMALLFVPLAVRAFLAWVYLRPRREVALATWRHEVDLWFRHRIEPADIPMDILLKYWETIKEVTVVTFPETYSKLLARKEDNEKKGQAAMKTEVAYRALETLANMTRSGELYNLGGHGQALQTFIAKQGGAINSLRLDALETFYWGIPPECFDPRG